MKKYLLIAAIIVLCVISGGYYVYTTRIWQHTSSDRLKDKAPKTYVNVTSQVDKDKDGIDDQTDILKGALDYVATNPKYKSQYYSTGYPDDEYGVCTDVVANACLSAGYDLKELIQQDISANSSEYNIEKPDANIDFRRVTNLKVYFSNTAISLTTDVGDVEAWQGGDIVIFERHIGIVSDRRNKNGVPYVIHHNDPYQKTYEEDILQKRTDIVGHYRISE